MQKMNRIQQAIFKQFATRHKLELNEFIQTYSAQYIGTQLDSIDDITEEDADIWINKAYLESLDK